jgi:Protein of unknown function (DUF1583)
MPACRPTAIPGWPRVVRRRGQAARPSSRSRAIREVPDKVTLQLNDQVIIEHTLEPTNQRAFGLFHYADETQARVRNVRDQGNWPRSLSASLRPQKWEDKKGVGYEPLQTPECLFPAEDEL